MDGTDWIPRSVLTTWTWYWALRNHFGGPDHLCRGSFPVLSRDSSWRIFDHVDSPRTATLNLDEDDHKTLVIEIYVVNDRHADDCRHHQFSMMYISILIWIILALVFVHLSLITYFKSYAPWDIVISACHVSSWMFNILFFFVIDHVWWRIHIRILGRVRTSNRRRPDFPVFSLILERPSRKRRVLTHDHQMNRIKKMKYKVFFKYSQILFSFNSKDDHFTYRSLDEDHIQYFFIDSDVSILDVIWNF